MEAPAVNSASNGTEKSRKTNTADYLQIDPSSTFINNTARNGFEELPENFLDTISPHPSTPHSSSGNNGATSSGSPVSAPQLASLAPMNINSEQSGSSYSSILSNSQYSHIEKSAFSNSTAGLLSPLHIDRRQRNSIEFGGSHNFIKEEVDLDGSHLLLTSITEQQQEMDRMAQAETPPAVSNVELASTMIASLIGGDSQQNFQLQNEDSPSPNSFNDPSNILQQQMIKDETDEDTNCLDFHSSQKQFLKRSIITSPSRTQSSDDPHELDFHAKHAYARGSLLQASSSQAAGPSVQLQRRIYSTQDSDDPLNAEIDDDIYIDTKDLCKRIAYELKQHSIPQAIFAERILCRSQGTLSDLLRNPKPWNKLKSGRETFRRMYNWVRQPLNTRLAILDMKSVSEAEEALTRVSGMSPPTPAQNVRQQRKSTSDPDAPSSKRPRLVFTDIQKRTLQAIFKETQRPSREMQQTIAEHLRLDLSTVANFFMNARRRSRIGPNSDDHSSYQSSEDIYKDDAIGGDMGIDSFESQIRATKNNQSLSLAGTSFSEDSPIDEESEDVKKEESAIKEETPDDEDYDRNETN